MSFLFWRQFVKKTFWPVKLLLLLSLVIHYGLWPFLCRSSCCGNSLPFLVVSGCPDIWTFGLSCAVQKYVIQNCEWFTLKTQMVLAGSFFMLPNNTQSKSPYMTVIFFVSASKRTKQHISSASFDRFWDGARSVRARKELLFQSCTEYMRGSCKINQDRTPSSLPVKIPFLTPETRGLATIKLWI